MDWTVVTGQWWAPRCTTVRGVLFVLVFVFLQSIDSIDLPVYQRCNFGGLSNASYGHGWETSTCLACRSHLAPLGNGQEEEAEASEKGSPRGVNVLLQITIPKLEPEFVNLAAGLLMAQNNVTVYHMSFYRGMRQDVSQVLRQRILARIPCAHVDSSLERRLKIRPIDIAAPIREYCSKRIIVTIPYMEPIQSCIGVAAPAQYRLYSRVFRNLEDPDDRIPDVVVTDMHGYGVLFIAEEFGIPSLVLEDQHAFYESTGQRQGQGGSFRRWIDIIMIGTIRAVMGTKTFTDVSRFRSILGLKRLKHRGSVWSAATAVAVLGHEFNATLPVPKHSFPPVIHLQSPIFPPCLSCMERSTELNTTQQIDSSQQEKTLTLLFVPPPDLSVSWGHEVTRGLSMARRTLLSYDNSCDSTVVSTARSTGGTSNCWHDRMDLRVKWMVDMDLANYLYMPPSRPPGWVEIQNASLFLDNLLHYTKTNHGPTIVMAQCDDEARAVLLMDVPILCLATRGTQQSRENTKVRHLRNFQAREIATKIVNIVWDVRDLALEPTYALHDNEPGSLSRLVSAIQTAGSLIKTPQWPLPDFFQPKKASELQWDFSVAMERKDTLIIGDRKDLSQTHTVFWWASWVIIAVSTFLAVVSWIWPLSSRFLRLNGNEHQGLFDGPKQCVEAWLARLPEFNTLWESFRKAWKEDKKAPKKVKQKAATSNGGARASAIKASETLQRKSKQR